MQMLEKEALLDLFVFVFEDGIQMSKMDTR